MRTLFAIIGVLAILGAALPAQAQFASSNLWTYEAQSHARWKAERQAVYGPNGPVREGLHKARCTVDRVVHEVKMAVGNPDLQYYDRWDRRRLGAFGPYPSTAYQGGMMAPGALSPVTPVYGGAQLNRTGGARTPTRWNPATRNFW